MKDERIYQDYLDDPSLSDDQKEEIIHALWTIIIAFVELGFVTLGLSQPVFLDAVEENS